MDEQLRMALIDYLNSIGEAPDPASYVEMFEGWEDFAFVDPRGDHHWRKGVSLEDLFMFLLKRQVA